MRGPIITGTSQTVPKPVPEITAITDKDGRATLSNLAPGGYEVKVRKTGYLIPNSNGGNEFGTWVTIEPAKPTQKIATSFIRGATISGTISDANGAPIAGASVSTGKLAYQSGRRILKLRGNAQTDDFGNYRLFWFELHYRCVQNLYLKPQIHRKITHAVRSLVQSLPVLFFAPILPVSFLMPPGFLRFPLAPQNRNAYKSCSSSSRTKEAWR